MVGTLITQSECATRICYKGAIEPEMALGKCDLLGDEGLPTTAGRRALSDIRKDQRGLDVLS